MIQRLLLLFTLTFSALLLQAETLPQKIKLNFTGPFQVPASMTFTHDDQQYKLDTTVHIPFKNMKFSSKGIVNNKRLITQSFEDIRSGKPYAYANFDTQNKTIIYGRAGQKNSAKMTALAQDFFTTAWQATLNKSPLTEQVLTTNGKKVYQRPPFIKTGTIDGYINGKKTPITLYVSGEGDDRVELGLSPDNFYLPALIAYYEKGKRYELKLKSYKIQ